MSIKLMSLVWDNGPNDATQRFVLLALADRANDQGGSCYPSILELSKKCAMSQRTVIRAIDALVEGEFLVRKRHKSRSNSYTIIVDRLRPSELVSDNLSPIVSDKLSHREVTDWHMVSDNLSPQYVTDCHVTSDTVSPDPSVIHQKKHQRTTVKEGRGVPSLTIAADPLREWCIQNDVPPPESEAERESLNSAAAKLWLSVTALWPGWAALKEVVRTLGDRPNEPALREVWRVWTLNGWSTRNLAGILERYVRESMAGQPGPGALVPVRQETAADVKARWATMMGD